MDDEMDELINALSSRDAEIVKLKTIIEGVKLENRNLQSIIDTLTKKGKRGETLTSINGCLRDIIHKNFFAYNVDNVLLNYNNELHYTFFLNMLTGGEKQDIPIALFDTNIAYKIEHKIDYVDQESFKTLMLTILKPLLKNHVSDIIEKQNDISDDENPMVVMDRIDVINKISTNVDNILDPIVLNIKKLLKLYQNI